MIKSFDGKSPRIAPSALISEAAYIIGDVEIGEHSSIWPGVVVRGDVDKITIGDHVHIQDNCVVHTEGDLTIGNNVVVGHGVIVHCKSIGNNVLVGNNATILEEVDIGDFCIIGAGALVAPKSKIPAKSVAVGIPAKRKGETSPEHLDQIQFSIDFYARLVNKYKQQGF